MWWPAALFNAHLPFVRLYRNRADHAGRFTDDSTIAMAKQQVAA